MEWLSNLLNCDVNKLSTVQVIEKISKLWSEL